MSTAGNSSRWVSGWVTGRLLEGEDGCEEEDEEGHEQRGQTRGPVGAHDPNDELGEQQQTDDHADPSTAALGQHAGLAAARPQPQPSQAEVEGSLAGAGTRGLGIGGGTRLGDRKSVV